MGITVHAIVEVAQERDDKTVFWWELATVEFNKNWWLDCLLYDLAKPLVERAGSDIIGARVSKLEGFSQGWPSDVDRTGEREVCDQGLRWCTAEAFVELASKAPDPPEDAQASWWRTHQVRALAAFLRHLLSVEDPWRMRVLFYTM